MDPSRRMPMTAGGSEAVSENDYAASFEEKGRKIHKISIWGQVFETGP